MDTVLLVRFILVLAAVLGSHRSNALKAGVAKVKATPPIGVPLAGYSARKTKFWPIPHPQNYSSLMEPSIGVHDDIWAKALVLQGDEGTEFCIITVDAIGGDGSVRQLAYEKAVDLGFPIPLSNVIMSGSHSHSGPGAITPEFLWEFAPATDLLIPAIQTQFAERMAEAMMTAYKSLAPAAVGVHVIKEFNITQNRRANTSPFLKPDDIDPNLAIIRVDDAAGKPLATVWNFAIHGTCLGSKNLYFSADIMGAANIWIENEVGGVSMFINADAGDIAPTHLSCQRTGSSAFAGGEQLGYDIAQARPSIKVNTEMSFKVASQLVPFGRTDLNLTLARVQNCSRGGPLDICGICEFLDCDLHLRLDSSWVETTPRFTAVKFTYGSNTDVLVTVPGEALSDLGFEIRQNMKEVGFDNLILAGYSNDHMGYFATAREYDVGGYESLLTFWGSGTAEMVRKNCLAIAELVKSD